MEIFHSYVSLPEGNSPVVVLDLPERFIHLDGAWFPFPYESDLQGAQKSPSWAVYVGGWMLPFGYPAWHWKITILHRQQFI